MSVWLEENTHFDSTFGNPDRFGNIFDNSGDLYQAGLLISPSGQQLLQSHQGLFLGLSTALNQVDGTNQQDEIEISSDAHVSYLSAGDQSQVYTVTIGSERLIVKIPSPNNPNYRSAKQPYVNEMRQVQELTEQLIPHCSGNLRFPTYHFASENVLCTSFEEGSESTVADLI